MKITVEYNGVTSVCELPARIDSQLESFLDCSKAPARILGDIIMLEAARELSRQAKQLREEVYPPMPTPNASVGEFPKVKLAKS